MSDYCEVCGKPKLYTDKPCSYCDKPVEKLYNAPTKRNFGKNILLGLLAIIAIVILSIIQFSLLAATYTTGGSISITNLLLISILSLVITVLMVLLIREVICWYLKINKSVEIQEQILSELIKLNNSNQQ